MPRASINYALAATLVTAGASLAEVAPRVGAKNAHVLRVGLGRKGVSAKAAREQFLTGQAHKNATLSLVTEASLVLAERAEQLKQRLSTELSNQVSLLEKAPPQTVQELQSGRTQVVKQLIESANALSPGSTGLTPVTMLFLEQDQPIDVASTVEPTPIGGVQDTITDVP